MDEKEFEKEIRQKSFRLGMLVGKHFALTEAIKYVDLSIKNLEKATAKLDELKKDREEGLYDEEYMKAATEFSTARGNTFAFDYMAYIFRDNIEKSIEKFDDDIKDMANRLIDRDCKERLKEPREYYYKQGTRVPPLKKK